MGFWREKVRGKLGGILSCLYPVFVVLVLDRFYARIPVKAAVALKLYPAAVNTVLFSVFSFSLVKPPTTVERFARLRYPDLSPRAVSYARNVTIIWCLFFVANGLAALATALWASNGVWALYNGPIAYTLIGALMGGEWLVRRRLHLHDPA